MKNKRMIALLMTIFMIATMIASAIPAAAAYTAVTPSGDPRANESGVTGLTHTMTLTTGSKLLYGVTYSFTVGAPEAVGTTYANLSHAVTGSPSIADLTYSAGETFTKESGATEYSLTKNLSVDWSGVEIKEPGVFRWKVTKAKDQGAAPENFSNEFETSYLWAYATVGTDDALQVVWGLATNEALTNKSNFNDNYPASEFSLSIQKNVTGNGSKEEYFKFEITLTMPAGTGTAGNGDYTIDGITATVPATAYNNATTNPTTITVTNGTGTATIWLKDGEKVTILGLPLGTGYSITETATGYDIAIVVSGDTTDMTKTEGKDTATVSDTGLGKTTTVKFDNSKETTTPTGVILAAAPAVTVIALGSVGLGILGVSKKRKEEEAE